MPIFFFICQHKPHDTMMYNIIKSTPHINTSINQTIITPPTNAIRGSLRHGAQLAPLRQTRHIQMATPHCPERGRVIASRRWLYYSAFGPVLGRPWNSGFSTFQQSVSATHIFFRWKDYCGEINAVLLVDCWIGSFFIYLCSVDNGFFLYLVFVKRKSLFEECFDFIL